MEGFVAGCLGGGLGIFTTHPLDTIKVRLQAQHGSGEHLRYKGIIDCFAQIIRQEGISGLYKGVSSPVIGVSLQNSLIFGIQRSTRNHFGRNLQGEFLAGAFTGSIQSIIASTVELSKIQLQVQNAGTKSGAKAYKGPVDVLIKLYQREGIRGPTRGFLITLFRDVPGFGIYFSSYAYFCRLLTPASDLTGADSLGLERFLLAGGACGLITWSVIFPIDVVKTRIQAEGFAPVGRYESYAHCLRECYREDGLRTFTRGLSATLVRAFPVNAVTLCTVSTVEKFISNRFKNQT